MSDAMQTHGAFSWCELRTGDVAGARRFYAEVLGWEMEDMDMPDGTYTVLKIDGRPVGGIAKAPPGGGPAHWATYVTVDDVDRRAAVAEAAGGKVIAPAMTVPGVGRMATVQDPTGAAVCLITYERKDG